MSKLLIFNTFELKNTGGPSGYLFNIRRQLEKMNIRSIEFLDLYKKPDKNNKKNGRVNDTDINKGNIYLFKMMISIFRNKRKINVDLNDYDYIHFHRSWDLFKYRKEIRDFKGKIILTFHSPVPIFYKIITESAKLSMRDVFFPLKEFFKYVDMFSLKKADLLFFPCEQALDGYKKYKKMYSLIMNKKKKYIPTGITSKEISVSRKEIRDQYNIPENAFLYCYVGRHNTSKGYDKLKCFAKKILEKETDSYFIIAGNGEISPLMHDRWIEVGWTDDPYSIIGASDLFILSNRETYFDIILLEVLSLGVPVMVSDNGGNRFFKSFNEIMMVFFEYGNVDSMIMASETIRKKISSDIEHRKINSKIFKENFSIDIFVKEYIKAFDL